MPRKTLMKKVKTIVVKVGTSTITTKGKISPSKIGAIAEDVHALVSSGYRVVIVSSGAIAAGASELEMGVKNLTIPEKQAFAALGQTILMNEYRRIFQKKKLHVGQLLLTEDDIKNRHRFLNARYTIETLLDLGIVPVVNENDSVVVKEIKFGDNDTLSAHVASLVNADLLVLLSDIDGFYMNLDDPAPVERIEEINDDIYRRSGGAGTEHGTGGMLTKIRAAQIILRFGEMMIIANGGVPGILKRIVAGDSIGTLFAGRRKPLPSRKKWITITKSRGRILIDQGAAEAVVHRNKSLLASGVTGVEGRFEMGDVIDLCDPSGKVLGKGLVNYSAHELGRIMGMKSSEIKKKSGEAFFDEVVHRDNLAIFD